MKYLTFDIKAIEDLKIGSSNRQIDNEYSLEYIPGTSIRGAIIKQYIQHHKGIDISEDERSRQLLLDGKIKFLNAYKESDKHNTIPFPLCFYASKDDLKKYDGIGSIKPIINELDAEIKGDYKKIKLGNFCMVDWKSKKLIAVGVQKNVNLHITKQVEENNLFRYEAIKKGQVFKGILTMDEDVDSTEVEALINDKILYIGGSKGSGYGKCKIQNVCIEDAYHKNFVTTDKETKTFYILALSDIFLLDEMGIPSGKIDSAYIQRHLNLQSVTLEGCVTETNVISGYNVKWESRLPQYKGIKAGSVFKYTIKEGKLSETAVQSLVEQGIGMRTQEGFGQIAILKSLDISEIMKANKQEEKSSKLPALEQTDRKYLENILMRVYKQKVDEAINIYLCSQLNNYHIPKSSKNSQLGNLLELIIEMKAYDSQVGIKYFNEYLGHLAGKKTQKINQIEDIKIGTMALSDYVSELVNKSEDIQYFRQHVFELPSVAVGGVDIEYSKQMNYENTLELLEHLIRYILRIRSHKGEK